jgi:hypothetical protein
MTEGDGELAASRPRNNRGERGPRRTGLEGRSCAAPVRCATFNASIMLRKHRSTYGYGREGANGLGVATFVQIPAQHSDLEFRNCQWVAL